jgi:hypothetical protein
MANTKISALTAATTPVAGTEVLPIVQSSATKQVSIANLTAGRSVSAADYVMSTGNLVPSTAAKGVNFTANTPAAGMTSQLLNWYEEGTWTPSLSGVTGLSLAGAYGFYRRIGTSVFIQFYLYGTWTTSAATYITGLPFTSSSASFAVNAPITIAEQTIQAGVIPVGQVGNGTTTIALVQANLNYTPWIIPTAVSNKYMSGGGTYICN